MENEQLTTNFAETMQAQTDAARFRELEAETGGDFDEVLDILRAEKESQKLHSLIKPPSMEVN